MEKPFGFGAARLALLFVAVVNLGGALFRAYQAVTIVRGERVLEFAWKFLAYPAALAVLAVLAVWWLRQERPAGAVLASLVVAFYGVRMLLDAASGAGGYPSATSRVVGQVFLGTIGVFFVGCATSLGIAAHVFRRKQTPAAART